jgi:hypothetical protein
MSIVNSMANCRTEYNSGLDKVVYRSKKYDVVFKMPKRGLTNSQIESEARLFSLLTKKERKYFPVKEVTTYKSRTVIIMEFCQDFYRTFTHGEASAISYFVAGYGKNKELPNICEKYGLKMTDLRALHRLIEKYQIHDIYPDNLGIRNNRIVLIDGGFAGI